MPLIGRDEVRCSRGIEECQLARVRQFGHAEINEHEFAFVDVWFFRVDDHDIAGFDISVNNSPSM